MTIEIEKNIQTLINRYHLSDVQECIPQEGSFQSASYLIRMKKHTCLLKVYSSIWAKSQITFDADLLRFHANQSASFPLPLFQKNGTLVDREILGTPAILLHLPIHGKVAFSYTHQQYASLGYMIGSYQSLNRDFYSTKSPPLTWKKLLLLIENTLPKIEDDVDGIHQIYKELVNRLQEVVRGSVTFGYCMNCIGRTHMYFRGQYLSEVTDYTFIYHVPVLLDLAYQVLELAVSPNLEINFDGINHAIEGFHAKFPLSRSQWEQFPDFLTLAALMKIGLLHLKKQLSTENPLIDQQIQWAKELYQTIITMKVGAS